MATGQENNMEKIKAKFIAAKNWVVDKTTRAWSWTKRNAKNALIFITGAGVALAAPLVDLQEPITLDNAQEIVWEKPLTDEQWAEDVKKESLDVKFDHQLEQMVSSLKNKLPKLEEEYDKLIQYPDIKRFELRQQYEFDGIDGLEGQELLDVIEAELAKDTKTALWEIEKVKQSIERIENEQRLRGKGFVSVIDRVEPDTPERLAIDTEGSRVRSPLGTTYYIDLDSGNDASAGTSPGTAWFTFKQFVENSRAEGDIAIVRRGTATTTDIVDLVLVSDGLANNPITITADYHDAWGDFASSTQTYTPVPGTVTMEASASITGIAAGDWVYVQGDDAEKFSYEVKSVSGTTLTLYLKYKGSQTGSGKTLNVMPDNPIWGVTTDTSGSWLPQGDNFWTFRGLDIRGSDAGGMFDVSVTTGLQWQDMIFRGDGTGDNYIDRGGGGAMHISKIRVANADFNWANGRGGTTFYHDAYIDLNGDSSNTALAFGGAANGTTKVDVADIEVYNAQATVELVYNVPTAANVVGRNIWHDESGDFVNVFFGTYSNGHWSVDDFMGIVGNDHNFMPNSISGPRSYGVIQSTTTNPRSGGGDTNSYIMPTTEFGNLPFSIVELFEYPIYADTTSKTYTLYLNSTSTSAWTANPTADELWIECEYYVGSTDADRVIKRSTGTVNFTGSTAWQSIDVTCQPAQTGILYLRAYYGKEKESGVMNELYVDLTPVIS
jgi:hypothetical protein